MLINSLPMGGAETFFVRLACALAPRHEVRVHLPGLQDADPALLRRLADARVSVDVPWWSRPGIYRWLYRLSLALQRGGKKCSLVDSLRVRFVRALHRRHRFDAVNAHLCWSERLASDAFAHEPVRLVGSDHGDYRAWMTPAVGDGFARIFARSDALVCPSEDNRRVAEKFPWRKNFRLHVVPYGFEPGGTAAPPRAASDAIVFGMVARGIAEKGWAEALEAFRIVRQKCGARVRLVLVGAGAALDELKSRLDAETAAAVEFAGYQADPAPFIA
ncbi:MAG: glycosyltransferase, partial [Verrucomicrobia bacterium]|nr:glycosyltransferase [Verrucomicrobiota bacterium]